MPSRMLFRLSDRRSRHASVQEAHAHDRGPAQGREAAGPARRLAVAGARRVGRGRAVVVGDLDRDERGVEDRSPGGRPQLEGQDLRRLAGRVLQERDRDVHRAHALGEGEGPRDGA